MKRGHTVLVKSTQVSGFKLTSTCLFLLSIILHNACSAAPVFNPSGLEAGVVGKAILNSPSPFVPTSVPGVTPQATEDSTISAEAKKISFVLNQIVLDGNHVFTDGELQVIFSPYLHRKITVAKLQELVQLVTDKYQKAGYFLSKALLQPQEIRNGIVKVTVIEGFISQIKVQGLKRSELIHFIEKYGARIEASKPIKLADLERYLLLINDVPGFSVKSVLAPDPKVPLGSSLTLVTEHTLVEATLTQDNYQTRFLGPNETSLYSSINSVFIPGGTLYGRVLTSDTNRKLQYYELRHDQTIGTNGLVFTLDGYATKTNPQFILAPLELFSESNDANVVLSYPIIRSRTRSLSVFGQFDYMNNSSTSLGSLLYKDHIRDLSFSGQYTDTLWKGEDAISIVFDKGLNIFNANPDGFRSRFGATSDFFKIVGTVSRNQFIGERFSLYALVTAQYADSILPAAETFIFGGPYLGRGYDWAQFTGDNGVAGKVEFRMNTAPDFPFLKQVQYYTFYDVGQMGSLIPDGLTTSGASVGVGVRAMLMKHLNAEGFFGKPLTTPNATQVILGNSGHAFLGYFQISAYL